MVSVREAAIKRKIHPEQTQQYWDSICKPAVAATITRRYGRLVFVMMFSNMAFPCPKFWLSCGTREPSHCPTEEKNWLSDHGPIRIGYQNNYLSFCAADRKMGELTGALKDYLDEASTCFKNTELDFEPKAYPSAAAAIEALRNGEVDCMFPSNLSTSDGEQLSLVMTPSMMTSEIYAIVRKDDQHSFFQKEQITAAVVAGDPNDVSVMMDHYPDWQRKEYPDTQACLKAVADREADCVLISNYQYNNLSRPCNRLKLTALSTGKNVNY